MLDELLATDGVVEEARLRGPAGVMALHGGLEHATAPMGSAVADAAEASFYAVVQPDDLRWHVPSIRFDPARSRRLGSFLQHVRVVLSFHGFGRRGLEGTVLLGGRNRSLAAALAGSLRRHTDLRIISDLDEVPKPLRGLHPRNPVNLPALAGVQLELSPQAREPDTAAAVVRGATAVMVDEGHILARR